MAMEIFRLIGSIFVDTDKANDSLQKTDNKAQGVGKTLADGVKTAAKWTAGIVDGARSVATGLTAMAVKTADTADNIDKMSQRLGLSRESFQELDFVLSQGGVDINSFQTGMKTLVAQMDKVSEGNATATANFEKLGISVQNADGTLRDEEDVLFETIAAFQAMEDSTEKTRLAQEVFGKQGQEILPLLNSEAGSLEEMRQQAHELGIIMTDETIDSGVQLHDTLDALKRTGASLANTLSGALMPVVQEVADLIIENMPTIQGLFSQFQPVIQQVFSQLLPPLIQLASSLLPVITTLLLSVLPILSQLTESLVPVIIDLLTLLLPPLVEIVSALLPPLLHYLQPILALLDPMIQLLNPILQLIISLLQPIINLMFSGITPVIALLSSIIQSILPRLQSAMTVVASVMSGTFGSALNSIGQILASVKGAFQGLINFIAGVFTGDWSRAWNGIVDTFGSIFSGIGALFKAPINAVISGINGFLSSLNGIKIPNWVPGVGGRSFSMGQIPYLEAGGVLEKGQTGFLEGNGAEAVVPLERNRKWIAAVARDMEAEGVGAGRETLEVLRDIRAGIEALKEMGIYLDTGAIVGGLAAPMDKRLGRIAAQKARA